MKSCHLMKKKNRKSLIGILSCMLILICSFAYSGQKTEPEKKVSAEAAKIASLIKSDNFKNDKGNSLPYRYFEPTINKNDSIKYPVILYLHGEDEAGTDNKAQLVTTECATIWVEPDHLAENPAYVQYYNKQGPCDCAAS